MFVLMGDFGAHTRNNGLHVIKKETMAPLNLYLFACGQCKFICSKKTTTTNKKKKTKQKTKKKTKQKTKQNKNGMIQVEGL